MKSSHLRERSVIQVRILKTFDAMFHSGYSPLRTVIRVRDSSQNGLF
jgi:hypothetical protein